MTAPRYLMDSRASEAGARFDALSALFDHVTFGHMMRLGVGSGWRCWEVGAGGPSVPSWLAERVGPTGRVLATDLEIGWLDRSAATPYDVEVHDVARDRPPSGPFDLIHARLVLVHVPERDEALARMIRVLRPGGWLLLEDFDIALQPLACLEPRSDDEHAANRIRDGFRDLLAQRGVDPRYGRTLPRILRRAGLGEVSADAYQPVAIEAAAALDAANVTQVRAGLVAQGLATDAEIDHHLDVLRARRIDVTTPPLVSAWGRRPLEDPQGERP